MTSLVDAPPRFVVTGCGRSGTGYVSALFGRLGIPCGHESLFRPANLIDRVQLDWPNTIPGDASWLAAPFVAALPPGTVVLHQLRDPVAVVRSFLRIRFFEQPSVYRDFAEECCPDLRAGSAFERACRYWVEWNRMAARAATTPGLVYRRYRLEDLDHELVHELCRLLRFPVSDPVVGEALRAIPRDVNTRGSKQGDGAIDVGSLPADVRALAGEYGYDSGPGALPNARRA